METIFAVALWLVAGFAYADNPSEVPATKAAEPMRPAPAANFEVNHDWHGKQLVQIEKDAGAAAWSPDGRRIGCIHRQIDLTPKPLGGPIGPPTPIRVFNYVDVVDLATGAQQRVALNEQPSVDRVDSLVWAADGKTIFAADTTHIWGVDLTDRELKARVLVNSFADGKLHNLALAADQKHLICRYEPIAEVSSDFAWMAVKLVVFDLAGKEIARGSGKAGSWGFHFAAQDYFTATGRKGNQAKAGYAWGVLPLARSADGAEIVVLQEEPARPDVLPMTNGLRVELASWTRTQKPGPNAFRKLDSFVYDSAHGTTVEYRAMDRGGQTILRIRREGYFNQWGGSRRGTYGVRGTEEKDFVSLLDVAPGKFGAEAELPLPKAWGEATYRPRYELMDIDPRGLTAAFWFYFDYRGNPTDKKVSGLALLDLSSGVDRTMKLPPGLSVDRLHPPRLQPQGRLLLLPDANAIWLCDPEGK